MKYYLAIDIGATSGRGMLGHIENNEIILEEVYRFDNYLIKRENSLFWDIAKIYKSIIEMLKKCKEIGKIPVSLGIDTFGVDYALLDENDELVKDIHSYRDSRTIKSKLDFEKHMSINELYLKTGVYPQLFNTLYQLYDDKEKGLLEKTKTIMFLPCYLGYLLTGVKYNELSIASTSGLINKDTFDYDNDILNLLGLKKENFANFKNNGDLAGFLKKSVEKEIGYNLKVINIISHDTGTGVYGSKVKLNELFLSSGTWSLLGVLRENYDSRITCYEQGFTNELNGVGKVRFLQNIVGMFLINTLNNECEKLPITEVVERAKLGSNYKEIFDASLPNFLSTNSMKDEIIKYFKDRNIIPPQNLNELYFCIYNSLAHCYKKAIDNIENLTNQKYEKIIIFGGGSKNKFLNSLTEELTNKKVVVGPSEGSSIGNIMCQLLND